MPTRRRLVRQAGDQVEADVGESRRAKHLRGAENVFAAMHAPGGRQFASLNDCAPRLMRLIPAAQPGRGLFGA